MTYPLNTRSNRFTPREHLAAGAELSEIRRRLGELYLAAADAYGARATANFVRAGDLLSEIASALDDALCREVPMPTRTIEDVPITAFYYGWATGPAPDRRGMDATTARNLLRDRAEHVFDGGNPWKERGR